MRTRGKLVRGLSVSVAALVACLVLAEVATQVYLTHFAPPEVFRRYASLRDLHATEKDETFIEPHRYLGYVGRPRWDRAPNRHNRLGYRGDEIPVPKPEGEYRIACLGGSTTYTSSVFDYTRSYPAVLERELQGAGHPEVRVLNAGLHGWTSWESLVNFEFRLLELEPDLIVVYHGINDLKCRFVWPPSRYRSDNTGAKLSGTSLLMPPIWEYSALVRVFLVRAEIIQPHSDLERTLDMPALSDRWTSFRRQGVFGSYPSGFFKETGADEILRSNPPIYFEHNLRNLAVLAKANGVDVVFATFAWDPEIFSKDPEAHAIVVAGLEEMNDSVRRVAQETGSRLYDFQAVFAGEDGLFFDDVHMTEKGAERKGRLFAQFIAHEVLDPR